jgi:6-methylsalicylate decarboxylase
MIDVHQHLWPAPLLAHLEERPAPPQIQSGVLALAGEAPSAVVPAAHDPAARAALAAADRVDRVLLALSHPLGLEALPPEEAAPALDAWHDGAFALGAPFGVWGTVALAAPDPARVDALLDRGAVGLSLPAGALASPLGLECLGPVLARLEARSAPLFVHPGAAPPTLAARPAWWPAMTTYVADMQAAWLAFLQWGRPAHPRLRVLFAMLAGGAPLHLERLAARGGPAAAAHDTGLFYDTSSYGVRAVDAMARTVGIDQLVYGSDRPVADPPASGGRLLGEAAHAAMAGLNAERLLRGATVEVMR